MRLVQWSGSVRGTDSNNTAIDMSDIARSCTVQNMASIEVGDFVQQC